MNFKIIALGRDYPGKITDFAKARNSFLEHLPDNQWILFIDDDAEATSALLKFLDSFIPPDGAEYYAIRTINLVNGEYRPLLNPFFWRVLVSNKVRYIGKVHEKIPQEPTGLIDIPIIHNHCGPVTYSQPKLFPLWNIRLVFKKIKDIPLRGH